MVPDTNGAATAIVATWHTCTAASGNTAVIAEPNRSAAAMESCWWRRMGRRGTTQCGESRALGLLYRLSEHRSVRTCGRGHQRGSIPRFKASLIALPCESARLYRPTQTEKPGVLVPASEMPEAVPNCIADGSKDRLTAVRHPGVVSPEHKGDGTRLDQRARARCILTASPADGSSIGSDAAWEAGCDA